MKISKQTLSILDNFKRINESLVFRGEKHIISMSKHKNMIGIYTPEEQFPKFGLYRLNEFINTINIVGVDGTELDFKDLERDIIYIKNGRNKIKYITTDIDLIEYNVGLKSADVYLAFDKFENTIDVSENDLKRIKKCSITLFQNASEMKVIDVCLSIEDGKGKISVTNTEKSNDDSNAITIDAKDYSGSDMKAYFSADYLVPVNGDYTISIIPGRLIKFSHKTLPLVYLVNPKTKTV